MVSLPRKRCTDKSYGRKDDYFISTKSKKLKFDKKSSMRVPVLDS